MIERLSRATRPTLVGIGKPLFLAAVTIGSIGAQGVPDPDRSGAHPFPAPLNDVRLERSVRVPMRDHIRLSTDLYFPVVPGRPRLPTILIQTPYGKSRRIAGEARMFATQGYVVAVQDVRGKWESEGLYSVYSDGGRDFHDTVGWIAGQPWSNGKVGTYGCSYSGEIQIIGAKTRPPAHAAMIAQGAGGAWGSAEGRYRYFGAYNGGAFELAIGLGWFWKNGSKYNLQAPAAMSDAEFGRYARHFSQEPVLPELSAGAEKSLPLTGMLERLGAPPTDWDDFVSWPLGDTRWDERGYLTDADRVDVPALHVNAWYDYGVAETIYEWRHFRRNAVSKQAADNQYLVLGGGTHCSNEKATERTLVGARDIGDARFDHWNLYLRWFDRWLRGRRDALAGVPNVHYYLLGANEWRTADAMPPTNARRTALYLGGGGNANTRRGDGVLTFAAPSRTLADHFTYDPANPVPSLGGPLCCTGTPDMVPGSFDQSAIEDRNDVLVYQTEPLRRPLTLVGPLRLELFVSSTARDTDFTAKLVDVHPDGRAYNVQEGILRARYRNGGARPELMTPGRTYRLDIDLQATANRFLAGHRLRLEVSSSSFPRWDRNLNTGGRNFDEVTWTVARNTVHHGPAAPSRLIVWAVPD